MTHMKCMYCGNVIGNASQYEIKDKGFCCSSSCKDKAERALSKPLNFQLPRNYLPVLAIAVALFLANSVTLKIENFTEIFGIVWGVFIFLLPFISKPTFMVSIRTSHILCFAVGLFMIVLSVCGLIGF